MTNTDRESPAPHGKNAQTDVPAAHDVLPLERKLMQAGQGTIADYDFGRFRVLPRQRRLLADGAPVKLGGRAFDVLMALIEASGVVIGKDALMTRVWPERIVEENALQAQIAALRKVFGMDRGLIRTVAGRGYQLVAEIRTVSGGPASAALSRPPTNLPQPVSALIGRGEELAEILNLAAAQRLVTLTGPGGVGKTRLAIEAARRLLPKFACGVWLVDLAPLADPARVPAAVAAMLGLECGAGAVSAERMAAALSAQPLLLVLDTCDHLIDAAAGLVEAVLRANPAVSVIATSREPLRAEGEWIYPVPPLAVPGEGDDLMQSGAVRLFLERACVRQPGCVAAIAALCRRLDGLPLAIELAAARAALLGVNQLADHHDGLFPLLTGGRRTAPLRHQSLRATLEWSYARLSEPERAILRRLAIFPGHFSLEAASAVAAGAEITAAAVVDGLANLVAKSLVAAEIDGTAARYRLSATTRAYALDKLADSGEGEAVAGFVHPGALGYSKMLLNTGSSAIPAIGFGTLIPDPIATKRATVTALETGFRHFDCAERYRNESAVGEALDDVFAKGAIRREDVFITTKLWNNNHRPERVGPAFEASRQRLRLDYELVKELS